MIFDLILMDIDLKEGVSDHPYKPPHSSGMFTLMRKLKNSGKINSLPNDNGFYFCDDFD